ncbi:MAG: NAD(P)/FAD-dependent oxidoreductase [Rhizobiaceae bacterium]
MRQSQELRREDGDILLEPRRHDAGAAADPAFIRRAIDGADLNALRLALLQLTGDEAFAAMRVEMRPRRGGALASAAVAEEFVPELKRRAFELLSGATLPQPRARFSPGELRRLMEIFSGAPMPGDQEFALSCEELALDDIPRDVTWQARPACADAIHVVIVGGGLSGVCMGAQLGRLGLRYTIVERLDGVGGTWLRNTYPDVRVDTDCYNYQFKFEKNYPWKEHYPTQGEVLRYVRHVAKRHGVLPHIRFRTEMERAVWDEPAAKWRLTLRDADETAATIDADFVVSGAGLFGQESLPAIPGIERFRGRILHTSGWDEVYALDGRDIALIGNGSSGVQLMPTLARKAKSLTVFQRTPQWIGPIENLRKTFTPEERWLVDTMPFYWNWCSYAAYRSFTYLQFLQEHDEGWKAAGGRINEGNDRLRAFLIGYMKDRLGDRTDLLEKSIPPFPPLSRRLVVDNGWYDALLRDNVELVTEGIDCFDETGIVDGGGKRRDFDLVVLGTGFKVDRYLAPADYVGRDGVTLAQAWGKDGPRSYLGMAMPGFPNFFMLYGPGSQARAGGLPSWIEIWTRYVADKIVRAIERGARSIDLRREAFDAYNASVDARAGELLWETDGKGGYYVTKEGRSIVNQPWRNYEYHAAILASGLDDYILR